jgi:serine protease DegQ
LQGHVFVGRTTPDGPAEKAGLQKGDIIVGVAGEKLKGLADFYRKMWAKGPAGTTITIDLIRDAEPRHIDVPSASRRDFLKLKPSL